MTSRLPEDTWFVGIDERTAILGDGTTWAVHGNGSVTVRGPAVHASYRDGERFTTQSA
jgi:hypothetical protein